MKVQSTGSGQLATLVKSPGGQPVGQQTASGALAFPVHVSKMNTKGNQPGGSKQQQQQQQVQQIGVQQVMIRRQPGDPGPPQTTQQQQQQAAAQQAAIAAASQASAAAQGKITHITTQVVFLNTS